MPSTNRGALTSDGCAVEVYRRLPAMGEPQIVDAVTGDQASILDLGAGVGRIADPLVELGHRVVAVDSSAEMLAHVRLAETVQSDIESLRLDERFDVVLLASHLVNTPDERRREQLLASVARHLAPDGRALIQWHPPEWFDTLEPGRTYPGELGDLRSELEVRTYDGDTLFATVRYRTAEDVWTQTFRARRLTRPDLAGLLGVVGLQPVADGGVPIGWLSAQLAPR